MPSRIWTREELSSDWGDVECRAWRVVEAQHKVSTMKITDTLEEQAVLEKLVEASKPAVPAACAHLHYLLSTPFRYRPYPSGSRFRKAGNTPGVFYCSDEPTTAIAELAFYRILFFAESPDTPWPDNPSDFTAFAAAIASRKCLDLAASRFDDCRDVLEARSDYTATQALEDTFRRSGGEVIKYRSVRDEFQRANFAVLVCSAFAEHAPVASESWKMHIGARGVRAIREFPALSIQFPPDRFDADARVAGVNWAR